MPLNTRMNTIQFYFGALLLTLMSIGLAQCTSQSDKVKEHKYTNALINESSPYLLQHAHNPVNWYPWGDEALEKAKKEDKLLIISVGYAACHWCHVMEHESFEDSLVAKIMNDNFVCVKVDREERPDVDDVYMTACHLSSGRSCGWPLNAFALPDGKPFWAGTYFPKDRWIDILNQFIELKNSDYDKLTDSAERLTQGIQQTEELTLVESDLEFTNEKLQKIAEAFLFNIDFEDGGRKGAPKFPMPNNYEFLLKYYHKTGDVRALEAVNTTLSKMALGGIFDQAGGGFARYSVDGIWLLPHFEKMLYDNGQLVSLYAHAYQLTEKPLYKDVIVKTLEFIERELSSEEGGYFASLDADSEGEEGKFYVWKDNEFEEALKDHPDIEMLKELYNIKTEGNWEHGNNILHITKPLEEFAAQKNMDIDSFFNYLNDVNKTLLESRSNRIRPALDDKILCSWNSLMLKGYCDAYRATGDKAYYDRALKNAGFIVEKFMKSDGRLDRNYKNDKSSINAFLDDYALTIQAFMSVYEMTFDEEWLNKADKLAGYTIQNFFNEDSKMFNYTSKLDPPLVAKKSELGDNVIPGSSSSIARSLSQLGQYLYKDEYISIASQMLKNMAKSIEGTNQPNFYSNWCQLYMDKIEAPYEIAIVGPDAAKLRDDLMSNYTPNAIYLGGVNEGSLKLLEDKLQEGETFIYVCQNKVCKMPVQDTEAALKLY